MNEIEILTRAMKLEQEGEEFFLRAAESSDDPETSKIFRSLADDEKNHFNYIKRELDALKAGNPWEPIPELDSIEAADVADPVFPKGVTALDELPKDATDEDALLFGLGVEVKTYELYSSSAKESVSKEARELFKKMAVVERGHFNLLMTQYEARFGYPR